MDKWRFRIYSFISWPSNCLTCYINPTSPGMQSDWYTFQSTFHPSLIDFSYNLTIYFLSDICLSLSTDMPSDDWAPYFHTLTTSSSCPYYFLTISLLLPHHLPTTSSSSPYYPNSVARHALRLLCPLLSLPHSYYFLIISLLLPHHLPTTSSSSLYYFLIISLLLPHHLPTTPIVCQICSPIAVPPTFTLLLLPHHLPTTPIVCQICSPIAVPRILSNNSWCQLEMMNMRVYLPTTSNPT